MIKNLAYLSAFTTFVVLVWITISIYNSLTSSTISQNESTQIIPLPPTFNASIINSLKDRIQVPVDLNQQIASSSESAQVVQTPNQSPTAPTVTPEVVQIASPSPTITPSIIQTTASPTVIATPSI